MIANFNFAKDGERTVASSFLASAEFKFRCGEKLSNASHVYNLHINILGSYQDQAGRMNCLGNLNSWGDKTFITVSFFEDAWKTKYFSLR